MDKPRKHWLNPLFRSETESTCSLKSAPIQTSESSSGQTKRGMKRLMRCVSRSWKTIKTIPSVSSFASGTDKEVVMEGYLPTTKQSLVNFLRGMGLKPKVKYIDKETIITADASQIRDEALKHRFINFMKKRVIDFPNLEASSSSMVSSAPSKLSSISSAKSKDSSTPSKYPSRTQSLESRSHSNGNTCTWSPLKQNDNDNWDDRTPTKTNDKKKSVGFKTVGIVPMVKHGESLDWQIPIGAQITITDKDEQLNKLERDYVRSIRHEVNNERPLQSIQVQPICDNQQGMTAKTEPPSTNPKKKKLRIVKHLRKWFSKKKHSEQKIVLEDSKDSDHSANEETETFSRDYDFHPMCQFQTVSVAPDPVRFPEVSKFTMQTKRTCGPGRQPVTSKLFVEGTKEATGLSENCSEKVKTNPQGFDGSMSMPVLITPDQSCFKTKENSSGFLKASKSSTLASQNAQDSYSILGNSAAIHIGKKRIRLEGKDAKYGSILQQDEDFDKPFRVVKENSLLDIENQVKKVKERIMFARAMGAVGDRLPKGSPKVDFKELLVPKKNTQERSDQRDVDVATTSSFYQKFLASMNILKTTHPSAGCDRSVMTDEPLSKTYAEFIDTMSERNSFCVKPPVSRHLYYSKRSEGLTTRDSSVDLPATSYLKMICTCWEPLFKFFPDNNVSANEQQYYSRRPPNNTRTEEEKILKCMDKVDKVVDCSRNKKNYNLTSTQSP